MIDEAWRIERIRSMDDSGQIETAYTTIDNLYGGSDFVSTFSKTSTTQEMRSRFSTRVANGPARLR